MAFLTKTTAIAAAVAIPSSCALSSSSPSQSCQIRSNNLPFGSLSLSSDPTHRPDLPGVVEMDQKQPNQTEFMVDMKCEGCVNSIKNKLQTVDGVKNVDVDLTNQVVRVLGTSHVKTLSEALEQTGRKARLIGQGKPEAAVAEFKGPVIFGVVRLAQVSMEPARVEASFSGLTPGKHGWSINEFGDLTRGAASTGKVFNPTNNEKEILRCQPLGSLGTLDVNEEGDASYSGAKEMLRVADLIGRSIAVYGSEDGSDEGMAAAVIAISAGVDEECKKRLCNCDGTTIWEATNAHFVCTKV